MSTSSVGMDEMNRKPLVSAYMFQRRMLLGCTGLIAVGVILWIVAISTDHWTIITGGDGIYVPATKRFFMSSHAGLWKVCRYMKIPNTIHPVIKTIPGIAFNESILRENKNKIKQYELIKGFENPETDILDDEWLREKLFYTWIHEHTIEFKVLKQQYQEKTKDYPGKSKNLEKIYVNPTDESNLRKLIGNADIYRVNVSNVPSKILLPNILKDALFSKWNVTIGIPGILDSFSKALEISLNVISKNGSLLDIKPPKPPKNGNSHLNYTYTNYQLCKYHDMFATGQELKMDQTMDEEYVDFQRTESSFAVITVVIMTMGCIFSGYTFLNPRYMFKRLAGGIHLIAAATSMACIQVLAASVKYLRENLIVQFPNGATDSLGYGVFLAYIVFSINLFSGIMFFWYSKKQKGDKAATDELAMADEAINIGR